MSDDDDGIFRVQTVPPPPGETDAYNAPTKVGSMAASIVEEMIQQRLNGERPDVSSAPTMKVKVAVIPPAALLGRGEIPTQDGAEEAKAASTTPTTRPAHGGADEGQNGAMPMPGDAGEPRTADVPAAPEEQRFPAVAAPAPSPPAEPHPPAEPSPTERDAVVPSPNARAARSPFPVVIAVLMVLVGLALYLVKPWR